MTSASTRKLSPDSAIAIDSSESDGIWQASEGQVVNVWPNLAALLFFWLIVPLLYAAYRFLAVRAHVYWLSDQRLRESGGLFFKHTEELELYRVKDISVEQPPLQRLFGRGRIVLRTSDRSTPIVTLNAIPAPLAVADLLRERVEACRVAKGVREID